MTADPLESQPTDGSAVDVEIEVPDGAPEADVLEQLRPADAGSAEGDVAGYPSELPVEADPADVLEQRMTVGIDDDYDV